MNICTGVGEVELTIERSVVCDETVAHHYTSERKTAK
jgi:hypothetical protein